MGTGERTCGNFSLALFFRFDFRQAPSSSRYREQRRSVGRCADSDAFSGGGRAQMRRSWQPWRTYRAPIKRKPSRSGWSPW